MIVYSSVVKFNYEKKKTKVKKKKRSKIKNKCFEKYGLLLLFVDLII